MAEIKKEQVPKPKAPNPGKVKGAGKAEPKTEGKGKALPYTKIKG